MPRLLWVIALAVLILGAERYACSQEPPQHIVIDGQQWTILVKDIPDSMTGYCQPIPREKKRLTSWDGMTYFDKRVIQVRPGQDPLDEADTVLHELVHATGVSTEVCNEMSEHAFINMVTPRVIKVLHDNPELMKYFEAKLK